MDCQVNGAHLENDLNIHLGLNSVLADRQVLEAAEKTVESKLFPTIFFSSGR